MPPEAVEKLKAVLDAAGVNYEGEVCAGARHGWCVRDHTVYTNIRPNTPGTTCWKSSGAARAASPSLGSTRAAEL
jgi:dienelactone hydrolase